MCTPAAFVFTLRRGHSARTHDGVWETDVGRVEKIGARINVRSKMPVEIFANHRGGAFAFRCGGNSPAERTASGWAKYVSVPGDFHFVLKFVIAARKVARRLPAADRSNRTPRSGGIMFVARRERRNGHPTRRSVSICSDSIFRSNRSAFTVPAIIILFPVHDRGVIIIFPRPKLVTQPELHNRRRTNHITALMAR